MRLIDELLPKNYLLELENDCYTSYEMNFGRVSEFMPMESTISMHFFSKTAKLKSLIKKLNAAEKVEFVNSLYSEIENPNFAHDKEKDFWELFSPPLKEYRIFILELKNRYIIDKDDIVNNEKVIMDDETLQTRTKLLLLDHLGVINFLKENDSLKNNTELSKFLAEIFESNGRDKTNASESIRTDLSYLDQVGSRKYPKNPTAIKKVNSILTKYGLTPIGLNP